MRRPQRHLVVAGVVEHFGRAPVVAADCRFAHDAVELTDRDAGGGLNHV